MTLFAEAWPRRPDIARPFRVRFSPTTGRRRAVLGCHLSFVLTGLAQKSTRGVSIYNLLTLDLQFDQEVTSHMLSETHVFWSPGSLKP